MDLIEKAQDIATRAHDEQIRSDGEPYINHVARVAWVAREKFDLQKFEITAWLHDVIEDSPVTLDDLREEGFDDEVIAAVDAITKRENEPYEEYIERVNRVPLARAIKLLDMIDNVTSNPSIQQKEKYRKALNYLI